MNTDNNNNNPGAAMATGTMPGPVPVLEDESCLEYWVRVKELSSATILAALIATIGITFSMFHLYAAYFGQGQSYLHNTMHVSLVTILCFLLKPMGRKSWNERPNRWFAADLLLILLVIAVQVFIMWDVDEFMMRRGMTEPLDLLVGVVMILLVMEASRRILGWIMAGLVAFFILQAVYGEYFFGVFYGPNIDWGFIINDLFMEEGGIYSIPISVSATYVVLFIMFGAFIMRVGVGELFKDVAYAMMGKQIGGPAKAAVLSSAFMASISGSAVSNVATTGTVTIPLMKRMGFPAPFAAAVEACASTGGVFTPPVMGAVAFIIAEFIGIPYWDVVKAATIPAAIYFISVIAMVHFRARKLDLKPDPNEKIPSVRESMKKRGFLLIPVSILIGAMLMGYSPVFSAVAGILALFAFSWIRPETRMTPVTFLGAFEDAARMMVSVAVPSAAAGLIVGAVFYSGLAVRFSGSIIDLAQGSQFLALILAMVICILLGMGVTVTALYILVAALVVPALINLGVDPVAAHFFAFHFGVQSYITPPVALSAFTAAAIAKTDPMKTGFQAMRLGFAAYLIPFMFVYSPELLWQGNGFDIVIASVVSILAVIALASAIEGWLYGALPLIMRLCLGAGAALMIVPTLELRLAGGFVVAVIFAWRAWKHKNGNTGQLNTRRA